MTCRILSFFAAILVAVSAFGQDCVAPCAPAAPTCAPAPTCAAAPTCAPICVPCINPLALVKNAACTAVNEVGCCAANLKARLCALKPCGSRALCALRSRRLRSCGSRLRSGSGRLRSRCSGLRSGSGRLRSCRSDVRSGSGRLRSRGSDLLQGLLHD